MCMARMNGPINFAYTYSSGAERDKAVPVARRSLVSVGAVVHPRKGTLVAALALVVAWIPRERAPIWILDVEILVIPLTPTLPRLLLNIASTCMLERALAVTDMVLEAQILRLGRRWASQQRLAPPPARGKLEPTMTRPKTNVRLSQKEGGYVASRRRGSLHLRRAPPQAGLADTSICRPTETRGTTMLGTQLSVSTIRCTLPRPCRGTGSTNSRAALVPILSMGSLVVGASPAAQVGAQRDTPFTFRLCIVCLFWDITLGSLLRRSE